MRQFPFSLIHLAVTALSLTLIGESTAAEPIQATTPPATLTAQASPATLPLVNTIAGHTGTVSSIAVSSDGKTLIHGNSDGTIHVLNPNTGDYLQTLKAHQGGITSLAISPNGQQFVSIGFDNTIKIWNRQTGQLLRTLTSDHFGDSAAISPDGQRLAASVEGVVKVWNLQTGELLNTFAKPTDSDIARGYSSVVFRSDGQILATGSGWDNSLNIWNAQTGERVRSLRGVSTDTVAFLPNAQALAICHTHLWTLDTGEAVKINSSEPPSYCRAIAISPDGKLLASANDQSIRIWRIPPIEQLVKSAASAAPMSKCPNNSAGASSTTRVSTPTSRNPRQAQLLHAFKNSSIAPSSVTLNSTSVTLSDNNQLLATVGDFIRTWDLKSGKQLCTFAQNGSNVTAAIFAPNTGQTLITGHDDSLIKLWNPRTGQQLRTLAGHTDAVKTLATSPDGQRLASSSLDGTVKIWNLQTGQLLRTFSERFSGQNGVVVAVSRDGQTLASADDKALKLWNLQTGQVLRTVVQESSIASVTFSRDGQTLISTNTGDDTIKVWNPSTGKLIRSVKGNESKGLDAYYLTISPDGQTFMVTMLQFSIEASAPAMFFELRNLATSQQITLPELGSACSGAGHFAFAPDGKTFACSQADDIQIWRMPTQ